MAHTINQTMAMTRTARAITPATMPPTMGPVPLPESSGAFVFLAPTPGNVDDAVVWVLELVTTTV